MSARAGIKQTWVYQHTHTVTQRKIHMWNSPTPFCLTSFTTHMHTNTVAQSHIWHITLWSQCKFNCCPSAMWQSAKTWKQRKTTSTTFKNKSTASQISTCSASPRNRLPCLATHANSSEAVTSHYYYDIMMNATCFNTSMVNIRCRTDHQECNVGEASGGGGQDGNSAITPLPGAVVEEPARTREWIFLIRRAHLHFIVTNSSEKNWVIEPFLLSSNQTVCQKRGDKQNKSLVSDV